MVLHYYIYCVALASLPIALASSNTRTIVIVVAFVLVQDTGVCHFHFVLSDSFFVFALEFEIDQNFPTLLVFFHDSLSFSPSS
jgi:hypothetical protein